VGSISCPKADYSGRNSPWYSSVTPIKYWSNTLKETATYNEVLSGYQPVKWLNGEKTNVSEDHLYPRPQGADMDIT
jgi:hypothetical protein